MESGPAARDTHTHTQTHTHARARASPFCTAAPQKYNLTVLGYQMDPICRLILHLGSEKCLGEVLGFLFNCVVLRQ